MAYLNAVNLNAGSGFPYIVMDICRGKSIPESPGFHMFHWHEDFQFIRCYEGETYVHTLERTYILKAGSGIFLNKNVVHLVAASPDHHYKSFLFPERLVSFYQGSPAEAFVRRIAQSGVLPVLELQDGTAWQKEILDRLAGLALLEDQKTEYYPYEVLVQLAQIWLLLIKNTYLPRTAAQDELTKRMSAMLLFIADRYSENITLENIASSAGISKSEAVRCFKKAFQETPYGYLIEYRLFRAAALLSDTDLPVGEIAGMTGFNSASHFGKLFKASTGKRPGQYRKLTTGTK